MRSFGIRVPILAATVCMSFGLSAWARGYYYDTVYLTPTAATVAWPTTYVASSYVWPTTYVASSYYPTAYVSDSYALAPTTYLTTGYTVRRGLFGRLRLVERPVIASYGTTYLPTSYYLPSYYTTSYLATSYYAPTIYSPTVYRPSVYTPTVYRYPTVWESGYVSSSDACCDQVAMAPSISTVAPSQSYAAPRSNGGSKAVQSDPMNDPTIPSNVEPLAEEAKPPLKAPAESSKSAGRADSPPVAPAAPREQSTAAPGGAAATTKDSSGKPAVAPRPNLPTAPPGDEAEPDLRPAPIDNTAPNRRESMRPTYASRSLRPEFRNVLIGRVESEGGEPLGEVPVTVTSRDNTALRRDGMTNAFGNFAIRLADGDWTVKVTMPSGRVYPVRSIRVAGGKIVDNQEGREVRNLIISY
jgi:hypothetical protein